MFFFRSLKNDELSLCTDDNYNYSFIPSLERSAVFIYMWAWHVPFFAGLIYDYLSVVIRCSKCCGEFYITLKFCKVTQHRPFIKELRKFIFRHTVWGLRQTLNVGTCSELNREILLWGQLSEAQGQWLSSKPGWLISSCQWGDESGHRYTDRHHSSFLCS